MTLYNSRSHAVGQTATESNHLRGIRRVEDRPLGDGTRRSAYESWRDTMTMTNTAIKATIATLEAQAAQVGVDALKRLLAARTLRRESAGR